MKSTILISIGAALTLTACSSPILRTTHPPKNFNKPTIGTIYYLPKGLIPITISIDDVSKKQGDGSNATSSSASLVNTLNINNTNSQTLSPPHPQKNGKLGSLNEGEDETKPKEYTINMIIGDPKYVPDFNFPYFLEYNPSNGTNDEVTINVGPNQLLQTANSKSADQTGPILSALAELAGKVAQLVVTGGTMPLAQSVDKNKGAEQPCKIKPMKLSTFIDPTNDTGPKFYEFSATYIEELLKNKASETIKFSVSKLSSNVSETEMPGYCKKKTGCGTSYTAKKDFEIPGIVFRSLALYSITLSVGGCFDQQTLTLTAMAPNDGQVFVVDVSRTPLVEQKTNLTIVDGMLTQIDLNKPSTYLALAKIPLDILKAIASVPNDILTLRIKKIQDEGTLTKAQGDLLQNEIQRMKNEKLLQQQRNTAPTN
jgi:hypothetical protein